MAEAHPPAQPAPRVPHSCAFFAQEWEPIVRSVWWGHPPVQRAPPNGAAVLTTTGPEGTHIENIIWRCEARGHTIETNARVVDRVMRHRGSETTEVDASGSPRNGIGLKGSIVGGYSDSSS